MRLQSGVEPGQNQQKQSSGLDKPEGYDDFSRALLNLSFNDRNTINEEIHGVCCMAPTETLQLLDAALYSLKIELNQIENKSAYDKAQEIHLSGDGTRGQRTYVNSDEFQLRFLRAELFDTKKAAARMVKYLDLVYEHFGENALVRPIMLSDFTKEDMAFLRSGDYQLLPYRDRSGRRILCIVTNNLDDIPDKTRVRMCRAL